MKIITPFTSPKIKNIIIFTMLSILALQTLYYIHASGVNIPHTVDDLNFIPLIQSFENGESFWDVEEFTLYRDQRPILPNLILLVNVALASWNVMYTLYFGWFLLALSIIPLYLLLKTIDYRLIWLIIPTVALLFNPAQYVTLLMDLPSRQLLLTSFGLIFSIYFTNRIQFQKFALLLAILFAIIASFSSILGLTSWIVGVLSLTNFNKTKKIPLLIWVSSALVVFLIYSINYTYDVKTNPINSSDFFILDYLQYILLYLSNGLFPHLTFFLPIQMFAGFVILSLIIGGPIYLKSMHKEIKAILPWIQFGLIGLFGALSTAVTRAALEVPLPHYITIAIFSQISALVIATMIFIQIHNTTKNIRKTITSIAFSIFIIVFVLSLSASYYGGWNDGFSWHESRYSQLECITNPIFDFECSISDVDDGFQKNAKILKELHLGPFADKEESLTYLQDPLLNEDNWINMRSTLEGYGIIEYIDSEIIDSDGKIQINRIKPLIDVVGWGVISEDKNTMESASTLREFFGLSEKHMKVDSAYVFIDNKIHTKVNYGITRVDIYETYDEVPTQFSGWYGIIDLRELLSGCHDLSIRFVNGNQYYEITGYYICIN